MSFPAAKARIESLSLATSFGATVDVLRLDLLHPVVSGNKWFKLKEYINAAKTASKTTLLTFGGAYSNHIVATAAAAKMNGLKSIGIIRGEKPEVLSPTLLAAMSYEMHLHFLSRTAYREKSLPTDIYINHNPEDISVVPEGGYGSLGAKGAEDILRENETTSYTHIVSAVGTGTTLAGLINAGTAEQKIIGIPVLKNAFSLRQEIQNLLPVEKHNAFELLTDYHFGGYAKHNAALLNFMNEFYRQTAVPTDFVYTGKTFFAAVDLLKKGYFPAGSKILLIHTGGLQGNASLKKEALIFG